MTNTRIYTTWVRKQNINTVEIPGVPPLDHSPSPSLINTNMPN